EGSQTVTEPDLVQRIVERVTRPTKAISLRDGSGVAGGAYARSQPEEAGEDRLIDLVGRGAEAECVITKRGARVVLALLVVLERLLRRQQVRADLQNIRNSKQHRCSVRGESRRRAGRGVGVYDEVVEVEIAETA